MRFCSFSSLAMSMANVLGATARDRPQEHMHAPTGFFLNAIIRSQKSRRRVHMLLRPISSHAPSALHSAPRPVRKYTPALYSGFSFFFVSKKKGCPFFVIIRFSNSQQKI